MTKTFYIVGNGFDLHHGIRSAYKDFGAFVKAHDSESYRLIENYFPVDDEFWSDFEAGLADFDADSLIENASDFLTPYGAEDWKDSAHHDYEFEIERVVRALSSDLRVHFAAWIRQLTMPDPTSIRSRLLRLHTSGTFLTFNYTPTLVTLYGVEPSHVVHIHGSSADADTDLILGHGWNPKDRGSSNDGLNSEDTDTRVANGNRIIDQYFEQTFKPTGRVIAAHRSFFAALRETQQILVMGHSLADVDLPYFSEIIRHVDSTNVRWRISYYHEDHIPRLRRQLVNLGGIPVDNVEFAQLADL